jgi:hypothetical protein
MLDYIVATANLHAFNYGLKGNNEPEFFKKVLSTIDVPKFNPKEGVKIQVNENEPVANESSKSNSQIIEGACDIKTTRLQVETRISTRFWSNCPSRAICPVSG